MGELPPRVNGGAGAGERGVYGWAGVLTQLVGCTVDAGMVVTHPRGIGCVSVHLPFWFFSWTAVAPLAEVPGVTRCEADCCACALFSTASTRESQYHVEGVT